MDIKPIKKRRRRSVVQKQATTVSVKQNDIKLKANAGSTNSAGNNLRGKKQKLWSLLKRYAFLIGMFLLLCALYLPASLNLDTNEHYQSLINQSQSLDTILDEASYMPQKFFLMLTESNAFGSILALKLYSFIFAVAVVYMFYFVCLKWLGRQTAMITAFLFASSSWMILSSQSLNFYNIYLVFIPLVLCLNYLLTRNKSLLVLAATLLFSVTLYSPGMVWPVLGLIMLLPLFMQKIISKFDTPNIWIFFVTTLLVITPLLISLVLRTANFANILVGKGEITLQAFGQNLQTSLDAMFISGLPNINLWLVGTPVFNYLTTLLLIFGLVFLVTDKHMKQQLNFILISLVFSLLTITFVGVSALSLIIPVIYLTAGFGIKLLLNNWYGIFPANPVARNLGLSLVISVVLLAAGYNINRYYIAWPSVNNHASAADSIKTT